MGETNGREEHPKGRIERLPERGAPSLICQRIPFPWGGKWVSQQNAFLVGARVKMLLPPQGTSLSINHLSPQAAFAAVPAVKWTPASSLGPWAGRCARPATALWSTAGLRASSSS